MFPKPSIPQLAKREIFYRIPAVVAFILCGGAAPAASSLPNLEQAAASKADIYAEAALAEPNGAGYEFFRALIPPLHYVNADFEHYPIVLSAPKAPVKARLTANGSAINARANTRAWNDSAPPVLFRLGNDELAFGHYAKFLEGPTLLEGYLPVVRLKYWHAGGDYSQETFASVRPLFSSNGVVLTKFQFQARSPERDFGRIAVRIDMPGVTRAPPDKLVDAHGNTLLWHDPQWTWDADRKLLEVTFTNSGMTVIAAATKPMPSGTSSPLAGQGFEGERQNCIDAWNSLLAQGASFAVPEPYVQNAWRTMLLANFSLINGDRIHYSAGNQYDKLYEQEGSQAAQALMMLGYEADMRRLLVPLLDFTRTGLEYHQAGHKLENVYRYYWQTRDAATVRELRPRWQKEVDRLVNHRSPENGLFPREQYCGDITNAVFSMNSNAKGWRALRDTAALLDDIGDAQEAARLRGVAGDFRTAILKAFEQSVPEQSNSPFVPIALFGEEKPYDEITASKMGSYWNLMANNVLGTEIFGQNHPLETGMLQYFQQKGGLFMGLTRSRPWPSFWVSSANLNPLYGLHYVRTLLRRDEPERALVSFYGMLAAGLTPDTFTCGEGCAIQPVDALGRQFYCPPNSAGNALWLHMFRSLLVQEWDLTEDGKPETLRLLFATPKRWLETGNVVRAANVPTAFGTVSVLAESKLNEGTVLVEVDLPTRNLPERILLRARVPRGFKVTGAKAGDVSLVADETGTVDISHLKGRQTVVFSARRE